MKGKFLPIYLLLATLWLLGYGQLSAQYYHRLEADFTIKENINDSTSSLVIGKAFYDTYNQKLVYDLSFPAKEVWVFQDSLLYKESADTSSMRWSDPSAVIWSIYHLSLTNQLANFGLSDSLFEISNVEKEEDMVITTYSPLTPFDKFMGPIMLAKKGKLLDGIVFVDPQGRLVSKQFYRKYNTMGGLPFPGKMIQITYPEGTARYRITEFENVQFNQADHENWYNYPMPDPLDWSRENGPIAGAKPK
ncbi:MAG: hypothetical protein AAFY71_15830 [Bacteroidota bacterium]